MALLDVSVFGLNSPQRYLQERLALADFFEINGRLKNEQYGRIRFSEEPLISSKTGRALEQTRKFLESESRPFDRVLISLQEKRLTKPLLRLIRRHSPRASFVTDQQILEEFDPNELKDLDRMGFNAHLLWERRQTIPFSLKKEHYLDPYNRSASIQMILSLKTKFLDICDDPLPSSPMELAMAYEKQLVSLPSPIRQWLIWIEHRRWVVEKLTAGYSKKKLTGRPEEKNYSITKKEHLCLVDSRPNLNLAQYADGHSQSWPQAGEEAAGRLDELDRVSVKIDAAHGRIARTLKNFQMISSSVLLPLRTLLQDHPRQLQLFEACFASIEQVLSGQPQAAAVYSFRSQAFLQSLDELDEISRFIIFQQIETFDRQLAPLLKALEKNDLKAKDADIIDFAPFILTWSENSAIVFPYSPEAEDSLIRTLFTARPRILLLLAEPSDRKRLHALQKRLQPLLEAQFLPTRLHCALIQEGKTIADGFPCEATIPPRQIPGLLDDLANHFDLFALMENDSSLFRQIASSWGGRENGSLFHYEPDQKRFVESGPVRWISYCPQPVLVPENDLLVF